MHEFPDLGQAMARNYELQSRVSLPQKSPTYTKFNHKWNNLSLTKVIKGKDYEKKIDNFFTDKLEKNEKCAPMHRRYLSKKILSKEEDVFDE